MSMFTVAQLCTAQAAMGDQSLKIHLRDWNEYDLRTLFTLCAEGKLPSKTTREFVTKEAIWRKVEQELTRRRNKS